MKERKLVFISSPFSDGDRSVNIEYAKKCCRTAVKMGAVPAAPHLLFPQFLDEDITEERQKGIECGLVILSRCAELWVCGSRITMGMAREIEFASDNDIPIKYYMF